MVNFSMPNSATPTDVSHEPQTLVSVIICTYGRASALFDLSEQVDLVPDKERYRQAAVKILETLCGDSFLARSRPGWEGILLHGVYHYHKDLGVDESVAWGDFFFVEALVKGLAGRADAAW